MEDHWPPQVTADLYCVERPLHLCEHALLMYESWMHPYLNTIVKTLNATALRR